MRRIIRRISAVCGCNQGAVKLRLAQIVLSGQRQLRIQRVDAVIGDVRHKRMGGAVENIVTAIAEQIRRCFRRAAARTFVGQRLKHAADALLVHPVTDAVDIVFRQWAVKK